MSDVNSIYNEMVEAGVEISSHESDLYVPCNEITTEIISRYIHKCNVTTFNCYDEVGNVWYDIPFAYDPWWNDRGMS